MLSVGAEAPNANPYQGLHLRRHRHRCYRQCCHQLNRQSQCCHRLIHCQLMSQMMRSQH